MGSPSSAFSVSHLRDKTGTSNPDSLLLNAWYQEQPPLTKQWLNANILIIMDWNVGGWNAALEILYKVGRKLYLESIDGSRYDRD
jgi:hypothetical protein